MRFDHFSDRFDFFDNFFFIRASYHHQKLFTAPSGEGIIFAQFILDEIGKFLQDFVPHQVAILIVDQLEVVQVDDNKYKIMLFFEFFFEQAVKVLFSVSTGKGVYIDLALKCNV